AAVAVLSARVGSIGDNRLGGWYGYRASKAALNMLLRSAAVELGRRAPSVALLAFHPGTTDTALSKPFQARVPADKLFPPARVADALLARMDAARADGELHFVDYAGEPIPW
ncbi:MAG TPA: short-chain dehydrogenase, partial [Halieaceae bacterium]|nr:short-chain dehydrogenase [Halieaceae bacterium]